MKRLIFSAGSLLVIGAIAAIGWLGIAKSANPIVITPVSKNHNLSNMNANSLNALLKNEGLIFQSVPRRTKGSKTFTIGLKSGAFSEFISEMPENTAVSMVGEKESKAELSRQRVFELAQDEILSLSVSEDKKILWWSLQPDPRVFRAETANDKGELSGKTLYRNDVTMLVSIPDDKAITEIRFYTPVWDGKNSFSLQSLGNLNLK